MTTGSGEVTTPVVPAFPAQLASNRRRLQNPSD